ncbi:MAG: hypothetical protein AB7F28_01705 [Candidatus Margulisiibacteriota bacterium]
MKQRGWAVGLIAAIVFGLPVAAQETVTIKADGLVSNEATNTIVATSNVVLTHAGGSIKADKLVYDTSANVVSGTANIRIEQGAEQMTADAVKLDLDDDTLTLKKLHFAMKSPDSAKIMQFYADDFVSQNGIKYGHGGFMTSCTLADPHYFIWSAQFEYQPEKRLIGYGTFVYTPIFFIPFGFFTPVYFYELGKRKIIWNMPVIGRKETPGWGWFVQNAVDYIHDDGKETTVYGDYYQNKGIGMGVRHAYDIEGQPGSVYYYRLEEADTGRLNEKRSIDQGFTLSPESRVSVNYSSVDAERLNSSGRQREEQKSLIYAYDNLGDRYDLSTRENQIYQSNLKQGRLNVRRTFNGQDIITFTFAQDENFYLNEITKRSTLRTVNRLPDDFALTNDVGFYNRFGNDPDIEWVKWSPTLRKSLGGANFWQIQLSSIFDIRNQKTAITSNDYDYFYKLPEFNLHLEQPDVASFKLTHDTIIARYQENRYDNTKLKTRIAPPNEDFGLAPNTYIFKQNASRTFTGMPLDGTFNLQGGYNQFVFQTPGRNLFEGDALYKLYFSPQYDWKVNGWLSSSTQYNWANVPAESNTPFNQFDQELTGRTNELNQTLSLSYQDEKQYRWSHSFGYDWAIDRWKKYSTSILIKPTPVVEYNAVTGRDLYAGVWDNLQSVFIVSPTSSMSVRVDMANNLNLGVIQNSNLRLKWVFGQDQDYQWEAEGVFIYNVQTGPTRTWETHRYELQTYSLTKNEHCRRITISYNKTNDEFRFQYTIDAFPKNPIGFVKSKEFYKLEGVLDESSQERF